MDALPCSALQQLAQHKRQNAARAVVVHFDGGVDAQSDAKLVVHRPDGTCQEVTVTLRIDTPIEVDYYRAGGILPFVLRQLLQG